MGNGLNPAQADAVRSVEGPLLVLAGAGTGKTRVVTHRIAHLIRGGVPPGRILAVTFTRKAAAEMQQRAGALLKARKKKADSKERPSISTFHSLCVRVLRRHITMLGYPERFVICDRGDQEAEARAALRAIRCPAESLRPGDMLAIVSGWKNRSLTPSDAAAVAETDREHLAAAAYRRYASGLKAKGAVDFDDLLLLTQQLFAESPEVRKQEASQFDYIMIDEYQDTNQSQYQIVKGLAAQHRNLCVVGDDDQSIYAWRGAEVEHILRFSKDWPEAKVVLLEENYRSTAAILGFANTLIGFNKVRHDKVLRPARPGGERPRVLQAQDEAAEAQQVVADLGHMLTMPELRAGDFAILCRTNEQPRTFEAELRRANIPYVLMGGMSFFDRKEVKDLIAYLRVVSNPNDEPSLLRVINTPPRGLGPAAVKKLVAAAVERGEPVWSVVKDHAGVEGLSVAATNGLAEMSELVATLQRAAAGDDLPTLVTECLRQTRYRDEIERAYPDPNDREARLASIEEVVNAAGTYAGSSSSPTLEGFLDDVAVGARDSTDDKESRLEQNAVALMTLHSAKGLEFSHVYLVGMEEGILPHRRSVEADGAAIDEERRLCYVGVTRAQERLTLSFSLSRRKWGKARETIPSRFLYEMTGQAEKAQEKAKASKAAGRPQSGRAKSGRGARKRA